MTLKLPAFPVLLLLGFLSTPAMAQDCGGDFGAWMNDLRAEAAAQGVGEKGLAVLSGARIDPNVLKADRAQGVFAQTFSEFAGRMVNAYRLQHGEANLKKHADVFARAEQEYGVPGPVITAFWALETDFGAVQGDFSTLNALVTLAHDCRRPHLFRPQVFPLLTLIDLDILPADVKGAWAGEIGQIQVLPKDYLERGRDGDGDGQIDLRRSAPDAIMTAANLIRAHGWRPGEPWLQEVRVPADLPWEQTGRTQRLALSQWSAWGVTARDGSPLPAAGPPAGLVIPMGRKGPAFLAYPNFDVFLEWNQSAVYTLTAGYLATRLAGAPPFDNRNPDPGLSLAEMKQLQQKLQALGHDVGKIDGILGAGTREAVRAEQIRLGLAVDGWPTAELLGAL
jgi:lytic murein transglycosylase